MVEREVGRVIRMVVEGGVEVAVEVEVELCSNNIQTILNKIETKSNDAESVENEHCCYEIFYISIS